MSGDTKAAAAPTPRALYRKPARRGILLQLVLLAAVLAAAAAVAANVRANLQALNVTSGFGFLENTAGFGVSQSLIPYTEADSYARVFLVGLLNTLLVSAVGVALATVLGFAIGIARLSPSWLLARLAGGYVEVVRNLPLLFQILFWYLAVLGTLPAPRQSLSLLGGIFLNNRGLFMPAPIAGPKAGLVGVAVVAGAIAAIAVRLWAKRRQDRTGAPFPVFLAGLLSIVGIPLAVFIATGRPIRFEPPELRGFNFVGGVRLIPELVALGVALTTYTAAFIAEIVRAGVLAVPRGQTEAALALGLGRGLSLRLIVIPQALRLIVPPLANQYLNLIKNSSLAVAIGYPDLVAVFAGTALNQTGQAIEILAMTMAVYLLISLLTSALMNWYNAHIRIAER